MKTNQFEVAEFDYTKEALMEIAAQAERIDTSDIDAVEGAVKILVKARTTIQKQGKSYRDEANAFNKSVLEKEKEYTGITLPLEEKYKQIIADYKQNQILEARKELLPQKRSQLKLLTSLRKDGYFATITDEAIIQMDDTQWVEFYSGAMKENESVIEEEARKAEEEATREAREAEIAEKAKADALAEVKRQEKEAKEAQEKKEAEDKAKLEAEKQKMEADKKFQAFLKDNSYDEKTDRIEKDPSGSVKLYRLIAEFKK